MVSGGILRLEFRSKRRMSRVYAVRVPFGLHNIYYGACIENATGATPVSGLLLEKGADCPPSTSVSQNMDGRIGDMSNEMEGPKVASSLEAPRGQLWRMKRAEELSKGLSRE